MFKRSILYSAVLVSLSFFQVQAQTVRLDWKPLQVTVVEEEQVSSPVPADNSIQEHTSRFTNVISNLKKDIQEKQREKNREVKAVSREDIYSAIEEIIEKSYPGGVDQMLAVNKQLEEDMYNLIKSMPDYTYQYFAPFLHTLPYMSERIMNLPGVKAMKGKFPTRIAPQMKEYVKKHGKYMSPHLYIYLMPEVWPSTEREKSTFKGYNKIITIDNNTKPEDLFSFNKASVLNDRSMPPADKYRSGEYLVKTVQPQTPAAQVTQSSALTQGDVEAVLSSMTALKEAFGNDRLDDFHSQIRGMSLTDNNLMGELLNPMQTLADKIKRTPYATQFSNVLSKYGFTPDSWGITADKMLKTRRVAKMSPGTALTLYQWRKMKTFPAEYNRLSPKDKQTVKDSISLFLGLYTTSEQNLLAVRNYGDNIRDALAAQDMTFMEAPIVGIY